MLMLAAMSAILSLMRSASSNDAVTFSHSASGILPPSLASAVGPLSSVGTIAVGMCVTRRQHRAAHSGGGVAYPARSVDVKVDAANPRLGARRPGADDGAREGLGRDGPGAVTARAGYRSRDGRDARERHHAPARHPVPGRSTLARLPRGRESKFCDPVGGFLPGGVLGAFPVRLRCRPRLDSTRAGALERYEAPVRVCGTGTEPRPRAVNGRGAKEAWLQVTRVHFSSSNFQCLISHAATRPSSVFNFGVS